ncbi:hypothetical protein [Flavobacterium sp. U410]
MNKLIDQYLNMHACNLKRTREYFVNLSSNEIVLKAALSVNEDSKMFPHQYRVGKTKTELAATKLLQFEAEVLSAQSFEDIFKYTEEVRKMRIGVGHLWSYDTALHIGFKLGLLPNDVYIQSGVKRGLKMFYPNIKYNRKIDKSSFRGLENLEPYQIENFLCVMSKSSKI